LAGESVRGMNENDLNLRAEEIFDEQLSAIQRRTDRMFAVLFVLQWIFAVGCAVLITPHTWVAARSSVHFHVWMALLLGGALSAMPIYLAWVRPGTLLTRMIVASAQVMYSALLIHLTGGRIETHFHIFGSLAFLAFYRDWRVYVPATILIVADHTVRGLFWPESVFGVLTATPWRSLEHAGWVVFEEIFLIWNCLLAIKEMKASALARAGMEASQMTVESVIDERTMELEQRTIELAESLERSHTLELQVVQGQKLESIGQLAAGIAHEINTPMQFVYDNIEYLGDAADKLFRVVEAYQRNLQGTGPHRPWQERLAEVNRVIEETRFAQIREQIPAAIQESREGIERVIAIVRAMKEFSHPGQEEKVGVDLNNAVCSTMTISRNRWKYVAELELDLDPDLPTLACVPAEINQVLLNLVVNAADAIVAKLGENSEQKGFILVRTLHDSDNVYIEVSDTGCGIPAQVRNRIFDPFFTTKEVGKGTGQGLAICYNIVVNKHCGRFDVESKVGEGTKFRVTMPHVCQAAVAGDDESSHGLSDPQLHQAIGESTPVFID
jgi:signal transduction histidine kinase